MSDGKNEAWLNSLYEQQSYTSIMVTIKPLLIPLSNVKRRQPSVSLMTVLRRLLTLFLASIEA